MWMTNMRYNELAQQARIAAEAEVARVAAVAAAEQARIAREAARVRDDERKAVESWQRFLTSRKPISRHPFMRLPKKERLYI